MNEWGDKIPNVVKSSSRRSRKNRENTTSDQARTELVTEKLSATSQWSTKPRRGVDIQSSLQEAGEIGASILGIGGLTLLPSMLNRFRSGLGSVAGGG